MQTLQSDLWHKTSFCTCSYLKSIRDYRASIVARAMQSWDGLLELPFAEKVFLDDNSPNFNGIKMLDLSNNLKKFDNVRYNTMSHAPHSNFGIITSMTLCKGDYIVHIDDDVKINGTYQDCLNLLEKSLNIMNENRNILGINLITPGPKTNNPGSWAPGENYPGSGDFAHPNKYFGTAACLMRKQLLEKVSLTDIINWGSQQPATWEELVSQNVSSFLVSKVSTPFVIEYDAWVFNSTSNLSILGKYKYFLRKKLGKL